MMAQKLPREIERLGPELQAWVEQQLLQDLSHYGIHQSELSFDWSRVIQEGHWTEFQGKMLESLSDIDVHDADGNLVANGWMDFVHKSDDKGAEPALFWLFLSVASGSGLRKMKEDAFLPAHLWETMTDTQRQFVATTDTKWLKRDPKIQAWKHRMADK